MERERAEIIAAALACDIEMNGQGSLLDEALEQEGEEEEEAGGMDCESDDQPHREECANKEEDGKKPGEMSSEECLIRAEVQKIVEDGMRKLKQMRENATIKADRSKAEKMVKAGPLKIEEERKGEEGGKKKTECECDRDNEQESESDEEDEDRENQKRKEEGKREEEVKRQEEVKREEEGKEVVKKD